MTRLTPKEMQLIRDYGFLMEKFEWLREHPGTTRRDYHRAVRDGNLIEWRKAKAAAADKAMRKAWLDEHPGEQPLPEHLCALDHPYPRYKQWAAKARRWIGDYERR